MLLYLQVLTSPVNSVCFFCFFFFSGAVTSFLTNNGFHNNQPHWRPVYRCVLVWIASLIWPHLFPSPHFTLASFFLGHKFHKKNKIDLPPTLLFLNASLWTPSDLPTPITGLLAGEPWGYFALSVCGLNENMASSLPFTSLCPQLLSCSPGWSVNIFGSTVSTNVNSTIGLDLCSLHVWGLSHGHPLTTTYWSCVNSPSSLP